MINTSDWLNNIKISDFDYALPDSKIAQYPLSERDKSKLLVYVNGDISLKSFMDVSDLISPDSLLVFNNTRVIPARLKFTKATGASIEIFCLEPIEPTDYSLVFQSHNCTWKCLVGNLKKWKDEELFRDLEYNGKKVVLKARKIKDNQSFQYVEFTWEPQSLTFSEILELAGVTPIPPYLHRESEQIDKERYQTVYSKVKGSVAAPTAGLHFTETILEKVRQKQIRTSEVTLHVGAGTFKPVQTESITDHEMHTEFFSVSMETIQLLKENHGRIISVGTTTLRTLESLYWIAIKIKNGLIKNGNLIHVEQWDAYKLEAALSYSEAMDVINEFLSQNKVDTLFATTQILIAPGYKIRSIEALITNFHQPRSTLLLLVSAITGDNWKKIYGYALENDFRFLSYGDSSILFLPND